METPTPYRSLQLETHGGARPTPSWTWSAWGSPTSTVPGRRRRPLRGAPRTALAETRHRRRSSSPTRVVQQGGPADLSTGFFVCPRRHTLLHDGHLVEGNPNGALSFAPPDGVNTPSGVTEHLRISSSGPVGPGVHRVCAVPDLPPAPSFDATLERMYRRKGVETLPAHLEEVFGMPVTRMQPLDVGVFRLDRLTGTQVVARLFSVSRAHLAAGGALDVPGAHRHRFPRVPRAHNGPPAGEASCLRPEECGSAGRCRSCRGVNSVATVGVGKWRTTLEM